LYATSFITVPFWLKQQSDKSCGDFVSKEITQPDFAMTHLHAAYLKPSRKEKQAECTPAQKGDWFSRRNIGSNSPDLVAPDAGQSGC